jgi:hypothetical protein
MLALPWSLNVTASRCCNSVLANQYSVLQNTVHRFSFPPSSQWYEEYFVRSD